MITTIVLDIVLGFVAAIIVAWFSRQREFRADAGAAQLMGRKPADDQRAGPPGRPDNRRVAQEHAAMGIAGGIGKLFSPTRRLKSASPRCRIAQAEGCRVPAGGYPVAIWTPTMYGDDTS
jgi:heat shock protein HtpX